VTKDEYGAAEHFHLFSQAADNNRLVILEQLKKLLVETATVLEIGSGSGQHAVYFAKALPHLRWLPSDRGNYFESLVSNIREFAPDNVLKPIYLDVSNHPWPALQIDHIYAANVLHIASPDQVRDFFKGAGQLARIDGLLCLYGPFKYDGKFTTTSNQRFDQWLKSSDVLSGIRDFEWICELAASSGFRFDRDFPMPANNQWLIFTFTGQ